jgi:excinuclease UvrABC nuclease subunit
MTSRSVFKRKLSQLPPTPGVYLMKDRRGKVIYVGKAAALRTRVRSYFHSPQDMPTKTRALAEAVTDFEVIRTETEAEAFLLEDSLIKRYQPRFNIRLRDDKRYPFTLPDQHSLAAETVRWSTWSPNKAPVRNWFPGVLGIQPLTPCLSVYQLSLRVPSLPERRSSRG